MVLRGWRVTFAAATAFAILLGIPPATGDATREAITDAAAFAVVDARSPSGEWRLIALAAYGLGLTLQDGTRASIDPHIVMVSCEHRCTTSTFPVAIERSNGVMRITGTETSLGAVDLHLSLHGDLIFYFWHAWHIASICGYDDEGRPFAPSRFELRFRVEGVGAPVSERSAAQDATITGTVGDFIIEPSDATATWEMATTLDQSDSVIAC